MWTSMRKPSTDIRSSSDSRLYANSWLRIIVVRVQEWWEISRSYPIGKHCGSYGNIRKRSEKLGKQGIYTLPAEKAWIVIGNAYDRNLVAQIILTVSAEQIQESCYFLWGRRATDEDSKKCIDCICVGHTFLLQSFFFGYLKRIFDTTENKM